MKNELSKFKESKKKNKCKGRIFRAHVNRYLTKKGGYVYQEKMTPLKRMSCKGCDRCVVFDECLPDFVYGDNPPFIKNIKDRALYELKVVDISYDWETGNADDFNLEFVELKDFNT